MRLARALPTADLTFAALHSAETQLIARVVREFRGQSCRQALLLRRMSLVRAMLLDATTVLCRMQVSPVTARPPDGTPRTVLVLIRTMHARPLTSVVNRSEKIVTSAARCPFRVMWFRMLDLVDRMPKRLWVRPLRIIVLVRVFTWDLVLVVVTWLVVMESGLCEELRVLVALTRVLWLAVLLLV